MTRIANLIMRVIRKKCGAPEPLTSDSDQYPYSAEWDAFISEAMDAGDVQFVDEYTVIVKGVSVWIANYPYAFGKPHRGIAVLPSLETRERLHKYCVTALIKGAAQ